MVLSRFTTCKPCVGELGDLEKLNQELTEKGGQVVGVNSFTLDGNKGEIADAKDVLSKKGVTYKNIWFKSDSEAGKFTSKPSAPLSSAQHSTNLSTRRLRIASSRKRVKHSEDRAPLCEVVHYLSR